MSIIKVASKKAKNGYTYKVTFKYKEYGVTATYSKSGFLTKKEAKDHESMVKAEIKENGCIKKQCTKTVHQVYMEFLEVGAGKYQANTIYNTKKDFNKVPKSLSNMPIAKIDYAMLQKFFNSRETKGLETNKNIKKALNRIFVHAMKMDYIQSNPLALVDVKGIANKMDHANILSYDQLERLVIELETSDNYNQQAYAVAIQVGFFTGLRISEVLALEKSDIDFDNDMIYANKKLVTKGLKKDGFYVTHQMKSVKSNAIIPLAKPLKQVLLNWFESVPYERIFSDLDGFYINPDVLSLKVKKIARSLNIGFHFHMLRHSFVTNLVNNSVDVKTVQELARHSNINTTMSVYTHIQEEQKKKAINNVFSNFYSKNTLKINWKRKKFQNILNKSTFIWNHLL